MRSEKLEKTVENGEKTLVVKSLYLVIRYLEPILIDLGHLAIFTHDQ